MDSPKNLAEAMTMIMECETQQRELCEVLAITMRKLKSARDQLILAKEVALEATMVLAAVSPKKEVSLELEKLKEENEKLKKDLKSARWQCEEHSHLCEELEKVKTEKETLKTENEKLKTENELLVDEGLDQFEEGDILEYASDCCGFQDFVEESEFYKDLQEEMAEQTVELETFRAAHVERIGQHFNAQMNIALMKEIEKLKTELRESQVDNVVNELVSQVCDASE